MSRIARSTQDADPAPLKSRLPKHALTDGMAGTSGVVSLKHSIQHQYADRLPVIGITRPQPSLPNPPMLD